MLIIIYITNGEKRRTWNYKTGSAMILFYIQVFFLIVTYLYGLLFQRSATYLFEI